MNQCDKKKEVLVSGDGISDKPFVQYEGDSALDGEIMDSLNDVNSLNVQPMNDRELEEKHLKNTRKLIQDNIDLYSSKAKIIAEETKELYDNYRSNNPELHNDLVLSLNFKDEIDKTLKNNLFAISKPYFGRIIYEELDDNTNYSLYIGKRGIIDESSESKGNMIIIDWRAPISTVYYDSDIGKSTYLSPYEEEIQIDLQGKRTYEISDGVLYDYYDANVIANDEFLTKYLGKSKEVVLGEIIATIQKEQNCIIRDTPWHTVIVQGVAGSGKTTVAMHRISYILYNYKDKFKPDEFYVIGSNKMLLNYITGVLPNLDVTNINQKTLEEFMLELLGKDFKYKKEKYYIIQGFHSLGDKTLEEINLGVKKFKGSIQFVKGLELYMNNMEMNLIPTMDAIYKQRMLYKGEDIIDNIRLFKDKSVQEKIDLLNIRIVNKVKLENERRQEEREIIREELKKYRHYFGKKNMKFSLMDEYKKYLNHMIMEKNFYSSNHISIPSNDVLYHLLKELENKQVDIYDITALSYIKKRLIQCDDFSYVSHIVVDEAQDFGVSIFYALKQMFKGCTYTIMGDVTQNIYYHTGMNDWEGLKEEVFSVEKDKFYMLSKSYRNTVEISDYASNVLSKCSFQTYPIDPVVRHGDEINVKEFANKDDIIDAMLKQIEYSRNEGNSTIAVICRNNEEAEIVGEELSKHIQVDSMKDNVKEMKFSNGVMVLPIHLTKGLEFDSVILYNPTKESYPLTDADAKLMYVAITRALHELSVFYVGELSELLV